MSILDRYWIDSDEPEIIAFQERFKGLIGLENFWWWFGVEEFPVCVDCGYTGPRWDFRKLDEKGKPFIALERCVPCNGLKEFKESLRREPITIRQVLKAANAKCAECGSQENLDAEHIIPVRFGGKNEANLQILCHRCNIRKDKEYLHYRAKLAGMIRA